MGLLSLLDTHTCSSDTVGALTDDTRASISTTLGGLPFTAVFSIETQNQSHLLFFLFFSCADTVVLCAFLNCERNVIGERSIKPTNTPHNLCSLSVSLLISEGFVLSGELSPSPTVIMRYSVYLENV